MVNYASEPEGYSRLVSLNEGHFNRGLISLHYRIIDFHLRGSLSHLRI